MNTEAYRRGIELFNSGAFFDAHEVWEDVWRQSEGLDKQFLQGLIQVAVAFHHYSTGNVAGARSVLERACRNLAECPEDFGDIKLHPLLDSLAVWRGALETGSPEMAPPKLEVTLEGQ